MMIEGLTKLGSLHEANTCTLKPAQKNGLWGYKDDNGKFVIPVQFQEAREFDIRQYTEAKKDGFYGLINIVGETIVPFMYEYVHYIERGNVDSSYIIVTKEKKRGVLNLNNEIIIPIDYDYISPEGVDSYYFKVKQSNKYGLFNYDGKKVLPIVYDSIHQLFECDIFRLELDDKYGFTNCNGIETGMIFDYIGEGFEELTRVQQNNKWGFVNHDLEWVIAPIYDRAWDFIDEYSLVKDGDEWYFLIVMDEFDMDYLINNEIEHSLQTQTYNKEYDEQRYLVKIPIKVGLKSKSLFDSFTPYIIKSSGGVLYINKEINNYTNGSVEKCLIPIDIDDVETFPAIKYAVIRKDGKYGVINLNGELVVPCIYEKIKGHQDSTSLNLEIDGKCMIMQL